MWRTRHTAVGVTILIAALCLQLGCASNTTDGPLTLQLAHVGAPGSLFALTAEEFARRVNDELAGRVELRVFGSSQLGGDEIALQKLKLGTLDFSLPSTVMSSQVEEFGLFEMPYLVRDREHMGRIESEVFWESLAPAAAAKGFTVLAVWENGFRSLTNNVRPIVTPADLAGIKLRTPSGVWRLKMFQAYGANPSPMPFSELFVALQTGVMDGQENPLHQINGLRLQEVQKYLSLSRHVYTPAYLITGTSHWQQLDAELRDRLAAMARDMAVFARQTGERLDAELLDALRGAGILVNEVDREAFISAAEPIYAEFGSEVRGGQQLVERAVALATPN